MQGTGQGRILASFMYKVYINGLPTELNNDSFVVAINGLNVSCPFSADEISLLDLYPSSFQNSMDNRLKWNYEFNHANSAVITFGEDKRAHKRQMNVRE